MTKTKNIIIQAFVCIPLSGLLAFCWIKGVFELIKFKNLALIFLLICGVVILSLIHCIIKDQKSVVVFRRGDYKHRNKYSVKNTSSYDNDKFVKLQLAEQSEQEGYELTSDGYAMYFTGWTIFTILFAPILVVTQLIGIIFAFISSEKNCIYSSYKKLEYKDYKYPFLQRILHFFFNFVIW